VNANARVQIDPAAGGVQALGTIALEKGVVEFNSIGGEFHDVSANIGFTPDGVVRIGNVSARGLSGLVQGAATARFDGLVFGGARAQLQVPKNEPVPLVVDGVQLGIVDGRLDVTAEPSADRSSLAVSVDVPSLHVELPLASAHAVQTLGPMDAVRVRVGGGADLVQLPEGGAEGASKSDAAQTRPVKIDIHLGEDVQVRRGTDLDVRLAGHPSVLLGGTVRASGQVRIPRGTLDVQGKPFAIDNGAVTFVGDDPANPQVNLTAMWTAPDGTRVYADFVGPLKTGTVTLRSEPARAKNEILSLILFGTTDERAPTNTGASQQASTAVGAAGSAATQPINSALGGVNQMLDKAGLAGGLSTKIDTSQTTPRPEVELQIARDVSLQVAWVLGVPPPGSNPDSTLFTLNWRFLRNWSLQTTVGSAGTSILDLIWQHRY
jgi:translocation and assembly module TamB